MFPPFYDKGILAVFGATYVLFDICFGIATYIIDANSRDRIDAMGQDIKAQSARDTAKLMHNFILAIDGPVLLINSSLGILVVLANRTQIVGDENIFSFGQVTALVTLGTSPYKIGDSLYSKPCVPS